MEIVTKPYLSEYVRLVVRRDIGKMAGMATHPAMPANLSEPLICAMMGWDWIRGHAGYDALMREGGKFRRIEIKYSMQGFVSCSKEKIKGWDYLAWVHAPERLPKVLMLIPSRIVGKFKFSGTTLKITDILKWLSAHKSEAHAVRYWYWARLSSADAKSVMMSDIRRKPVKIKFNRAYELLTVDSREPGEYAFSPAIAGKDIFLEAVNGIFQNRQHKLFLWL